MYLISNNQCLIVFVLPLIPLFGPDKCRPNIQFHDIIIIFHFSDTWQQFVYLDYLSSNKNSICKNKLNMDIIIESYDSLANKIKWLYTFVVEKVICGSVGCGGG